MNAVRFFPIAVAACVACAVPREDAPNPVYVGMTHTTSTEAPHWEAGLSPNLRLSPELMRACTPQFGGTFADLPYWFTPGALAPADEDILLQLARCVSAGRVGKRTIRLVAAASSPRQDAGARAAPALLRAERAQSFLFEHGVPSERVAVEAVGANDVPGAGAIAPTDGRVAVELSRK